MWRIALGSAKDRVISTVDPESRHMHKSNSKHRDGLQGPHRRRCPTNPSASNKPLSEDDWSCMPNSTFGPAPGREPFQQMSAGLRTSERSFVRQTRTDV